MMNGDIGAFEQDYRGAFLRFLDEQGEAALEQAYELGRRAMADGLGIHEIAAVHRRVQAEALDGAHTVEDCIEMPERAFDFLNEALSPYELTFRGFNDAIAQLREMNQTLERRVAERTEEAERARDEAMAASNAKSEFLAVMSHELRTPLNAIVGYADLLLMDTPKPLPDESKEQVSRIVANARHLVEIVEQVLSFARVEADREPVHIERADLREVTRTAAALVEPLAKEKGLHFRIRVPRQPCPLVTDAGKIRQILLNLLSNAVKFTHHGHVSMCACIEDGSAVVTVRDTGVGIAAEDRERVFEAFSQAESPTRRDTEGTGLGLSVSRQLARLLGGDLILARPPHKGSRFRLHVPVRTEPPRSGSSREKA